MRKETWGKDLLCFSRSHSPHLHELTTQKLSNAVLLGFYGGFIASPRLTKSLAIGYFYLQPFSLPGRSGSGAESSTFFY